MKPDGLYFDIVGSPLKEKTSAEIKHMQWTDPKNEARLRGLKEQAEAYAATDYLVMLGAPGWTAGLLQQFQWLLGHERAFYALAGEPELADYVIETLAEQDIDFWNWAVPHLGTDISVVLYADDYGFQDAPAMSHKMFEHFFKERYRRIFETIKENAPHVKIFFHTCGASRFIIPDLIEVGVDILNPVQVSAAGMETDALKRDFGRDVVFWGGGIDTQRVLPAGTTEEVRDEVKRRIDDLAPGGGFVFNTVHNIQADVPPENIMAMWETLQAYGVY
jgi:uroporphyrinogen decarboxylase